MKKKLKKQFLPFNYMQTLYKNLQDLKQMVVLKATRKHCINLYQLLDRVVWNESEDKMMSRYINGLKFSIKEILSLQSIGTVSEACNCWLKSKQ